MRDRVMLLHRGCSPGILKASSVSPPVVEDFEVTTFASGGTTQTHATGLTWVSPQYLMSILALTPSGGLTGVAGDDDDTAATIIDEHAQEGHAHADVWTVEGTLDSNMLFTTATAERSVLGKFAISGTDTVNVSAGSSIADETNNDPVAPDITTTKDQCLVIHAITAQGGHTIATIEAACPGDEVFLGAGTTGADETNEALNSAGFSYEVQETAGAVGTSTWTDALDDNQSSASLSIAMEPL